jgi:DNA-binding NtrC family response regulator
MAHRARVLVVDDDLDALYYVDQLLAELGHHPLKVTSADDAADVIAAISFDAVIIAFDLLATASTTALAGLERMPGGVPVLVMAKPTVRPEGLLSSLRRFTEHPPALDELAGALDSCVPIALRSSR